MSENIYTDLETSKKLKKLGFDAKTNFYWVIYLDKETNENETHLEFSGFLNLDHIQGSVYSCKTYTLEQVLNKLPKSFKSSFLNYTLNFDYTEECIEYKWISDEPYTEDKVLIYQLRDITENWATTAAKLWIKLKESEIV